MRQRSVRHPDARNGRVLVSVRRLQPGLGVGDLLGQHLGGVERVQPEREVVELDRIQHGRQILRTQLGGLLVAEPAAGLNRAADELHRVREGRDFRYSDNRTVRRVVDLVHVRRGRGKHVQRRLQTVQRVRLQERVGRFGQVVDVVGQHFAVLVQERPHRRQQAVELLQRIGQVAVVAHQPAGDVGEVLVQRHELFVVLVQRVDEQRQAAHHREEVATAFVQRGQCPRQAVQRGVDLLALALQAVREGFENLAKRPGRLILGGAQLVDDVGDAVAQLIPLNGHLGAFQRDHRVVGQHRATLVGRLQLDGARCDQGRVEDHRGGVGRHLVLVLVVEGDLHLVAGRLDVVDLAYLQAHDLDLVPRVEGIRTREVGDHGVVGQLLIQLQADECGNQAEHQHQGPDDDGRPGNLG